VLDWFSAPARFVPCAGVSWCWAAAQPPPYGLDLDFPPGWFLVRVVTGGTGCGHVRGSPPAWRLAVPACRAGFLARLV